MSEENVAVSPQAIEVISAAVDALNRIDADAFVAVLHPDVEWEASDERSVGFRQTYRGRTEVRRWFRDAFEPWGSLRFQVEEISEASDDRVLLGMLMTTRGEASGAETELRLWQVFWFTDDQVARRMGPYSTRETALEATEPRK